MPESALCDRLKFPDTGDQLKARLFLKSSVFCCFKFSLHTDCDRYDTRRRGVHIEIAQGIPLSFDVFLKHLRVGEYMSCKCFSCPVYHHSSNISEWDNQSLGLLLFILIHRRPGDHDISRCESEACGQDVFGHTLVSALPVDRPTVDRS